MKTETLRSLVLDRSLGELTPEVDELLVAYLAQQPALAAEAKRIQATVDLVRLTVMDTAEKPSVPAIRHWRAPAPGPVGLSRSELLRLAAVLVVGLAAGWAATFPRRSTADEPAARPARAIAAASTAIAAPVDTFWSVTAFPRDRASQRLADRAYQLRWDSPGKLPHLEEKKP